MKRLVILLLVLVIMPLAYADIKLDSFSKQNYNLGDVIGAKGYVLESAEVEGILRMDIICNSSVPVYFNLVNLGVDERHDFSQTIPVRRNMVGDCHLNVKLEDLDKVISEVDSEIIKISNKLIVSSRTNKVDYEPGDEVVVSGNVETLNGKIVEKGSVVVNVDGRRYNDEVTNGLFDYVFNLAEDVKSGNYNISVNVEDEYGNIGVSELNINVKSIVKKIDLEISKLMYRPKDDVVFTARVYDQAGELLDRGITFEFVDKKGNIKEMGDINSNDEFKFNLDQFSAPGTWTVRVREEGIIAERVITVDEVKKIEMWLENTTLFVRNIGNVDYDDEIEVDLKGDKTFKITKTRTIKPDQTITIDLSDEVPKGEYVVSNPNNLITGNVVLGGGNGITKTAGYVVLGVLFLFLIYMVAKKGKRVDLGRDRDRMEGKRMKEKLTKIVKKPRFGFSGPKVNEKDMKHWVEKATGVKENDDNKKGLFDMFN